MSTAKAQKEVAADVSEGVYAGVKLAEVDKPRLRKLLGSKTASTTKLLDEYQARIKEQKANGVSLVHCNNCNAMLPSDEQECPVCGDVDEVDSLDVSKAVVVPAVAEEVVPVANDGRLGALDAAVAEVRRLKNDVLKSGWELGIKLFEIYENKLWLERKDANGAPRYKNFEEMCKPEFGMSGVHARNMMLVGKLPKELPGVTKEVVEDVGFTKLKIVATANVHDRAALFELAKENTPLRELMVQAKMLRGQTAVAASKGAAARKPSSPVAPLPPTPAGVKGGVTVVFKMGKVEMKMEMDAKSKCYRCREELMNAVVTYYEFNPKTGVLKITREREE